MIAVMPDTPIMEKIQAMLAEQSTVPSRQESEARLTATLARSLGWRVDTLDSEQT